MKIKHWQGYGTVDAKKISANRIDPEVYVSTYEDRRNNGNGRWLIIPSYDANLVKIVIRVSGNHEYGLIRNNIYDLYNWLISRFDKKVKEYEDVLGFEYESGYDKNDNNLDEEFCEYTFIVVES